MKTEKQNRIEQRINRLEVERDEHLSNNRPLSAEMIQRTIDNLKTKL